MYYPLFDLQGLILLMPAIALSLWAQWKVKSTYTHFSEIGTRSGLTGAEVARLILRDANMGLTQNPGAHTGQAVGLEAIPGNLSDHYDPRSRTLRLSEGVFHGRSISAIGVAAHEVGHAIQHANAYAPLLWRNAIAGPASIGTQLSFFLVFLGFIFNPLLYVGIALFSVFVVFTLITLPVEFDASRRALKALSAGGYLQDDELDGARRVLSAAAWTYVAAATVAIMHLVRMLLIAQRRN